MGSGAEYVIDSFYEEQRLKREAEEANKGESMDNKIEIKFLKVSEDHCKVYIDGQLLAEFTPQETAQEGNESFTIFGVRV